ncbi:MAG TPA: DUF6152 family protein [Hyphomicrobiales bacterium]|nr:DUF6152 family protein [Hyphomicrobiales bacterium]
MPFAPRPLIRALAACAFALGACGASAHHNLSAKFNTAQSQNLQGRLSRVDWAFPHVHLFIEVQENGTSDPWYVELESPQLLELNGWDENTLRVGEVLTVEGPRARDGSRQIWGDNVMRADGQAVMNTTRYPDLLSSIPDAPMEATPRWPDGTPRLGAPPGRSGYWVPTKTTLQEDGANVAMSVTAQLQNIADAGKVAPLQEWAQHLYEFRQQSFQSSDPTFVECRPLAGPRKFLDPYGIQLLEDKALQRIFVIAGGSNHDWHLIYIDGRPLDGDEFELDAGNLLYYGRNSAHWDGDTFIIESEGYNEKFWLPGGLPHTDLMHATERLTRPDYHTLTYEVTIDDPGAYTRPWKASWSFKWLEGQDPPEHYCQDNRL